MNPKNALFLSASLTAFVLAVLFGVVTKVTATPIAQAAPAPTVAMATTAPNTEVPTQVDPTATQQGPLGPEEAAGLAAKAISRQDVYSVETSTLNGADSYKVVFSSGDVVYVGLDRQVLQMTKLAAVVSSAPVATTKPTKKHRDDNSNNNNTSSNAQVQAPAAPPSSGGGEHEGGGGGHDD